MEYALKPGGLPDGTVRTKNQGKINRQWSVTCFSPLSTAPPLLRQACALSHPINNPLVFEYIKFDGKKERPVLVSPEGVFLG